jgi:protein TonB
VPPQIRERPALLLPAEATQAGLSGNVLLLVEVLEDGRVGKIIINRSSGSKLLDESARENLSRWRFEPARQPQGNKPVRAMTSVWVRYVKEGS